MDSVTALENLGRQLAALCLYREARGESLAAKTAVWAVIKNRAADPRKRWPTDVVGVVIQPYQFSSFNKTDANVTNWPHPKRQGDWKAYLDCWTVLETVLEADPTGGAQFYHDSSIAPPVRAWLGNGKTEADLLKCKTAEIGRLSFYRID